ncbi:MAG: AraC family transcriptional regulator [Planctomyces sp.]|nr:AraC family transcriptional regulator [Planctomyces sp.]
MIQATRAQFEEFQGRVEPSASRSLPGPITFVLFPEFTSIALFSMVEALRVANRYVPEKYLWTLASLDGQPVADLNGILVSVDRPYDETGDRPGTVLLAGGNDPELAVTSTFLSWLKRQAGQGVCVGGIDTGPQILAMADLLDGFRATLHWENAPAFQERYPNTQLTSNLFEFDRNRITCAGGTAGIDMVLHAVENDHGHEYAIRISEHFMHERIRCGSERQRMKVPDRLGIHHPKIVKSVELMEKWIEEPLSTTELADAVELSPRQLSRLFKEHLGVTPGHFYLEVRLERARQMLIHSDLSVIAIALACGFQSQSHFSRVYRDKFGVPPRSSRKPARVCHFPAMDSLS